ncbi:MULTISPECIES: phosphoadenylyl-sulfate reductase [Henriciella]|jgi:phosphoadenosine phosphosulfate reductase|uniref:Adenosine 5'-phosphosulfate reductase n=1 Tax=Henriciella pelagia TaxID=1977912 RepID=A0ABQ1J9R4_9PROT|nr:phosphoadenylyl-sulfate reductase [Henriciella pelagia]GGB63271.1 phosphoadenylyl-sulfate reductase (thioredoxin) [Henriciella pelagia]
MPYADYETRAAQPVDERLARLNGELRDASATTILRVSFLREWENKITYVSSFGAESAVMLALIADVAPDLPIVFLETGMHFPQTLDYKEELTERLGLTNVRDIPPSETERKILDPKNTLWKSDPDACCALRKVRPLEPALEGFDAWITGRKRFHGGARLSLPVFEFSQGRFKVNPLASWTQDDVNSFLERRNLPKHPLVAQGYPSIGCWPCTKPAADPGDIRSGRWAGQAKTECGLHVDKTERPRVF